MPEAETQGPSTPVGMTELCGEFAGHHTSLGVSLALL